mmetsp:Transcript_24866/g.36492  ORF Transcript_24866/g.36492 Transcript_24866/m.36492 type:complete len:207 (+) Transcript_24866:272-892(+)|eukprot:CAMPEP_0195523334 /NCGR_PEP_ID=MMETSP0794_2-20130614/22371_1 /TAXON_ID=515487 /ORGANISM="Stephanopyxis turris, Strain CCMP 815" /LENGTH=206 /DNA_ID=CAMNT_0040653309 /DNA_START=270 /DNA_END=890 /DNA_ORIENTATION=-
MEGTDRSSVDGESNETTFSALFKACESDPKGAVHKAWALALLLKIVLFVSACLVVLNLETNGGSSKALVFAAMWTALVQLAMAITGSFILRRFPSSFTIGFFLGLLVVVAQQNLILYATFNDYNFGQQRSNRVFAFFALALAIVYIGFALILANFREHILMSPGDLDNVAGFRRFCVGDQSVTNANHQKFDAAGFDDSNNGNDTRL